MDAKNYLFFGGTFNPIHIGHLILAQIALDQVDKANRVVFIPNGDPPHKNNEISSTHRLNMCLLAVENRDNFGVIDYECKKEGYSYTLETIEFLRKNYGIEKPKLLIGFDNLKELPTWYRIDELVEKCTFIVGLYNPFFLDTWFLEQPFLSFPFYKKMDVIFFETPIINIRSTTIRERIREGKSISHMVPEKIEEYIKKNNLYIKK